MDEFYINFDISGKYGDFESWQKAALSSPAKKRKKWKAEKREMWNCKSEIEKRRESSMCFSFHYTKMRYVEIIGTQDCHDTYMCMWNFDQKKNLYSGFNPQYTPVVFKFIIFAATIILSYYTSTTNQAFLQDRQSHWDLGDYLTIGREQTNSYVGN